MAHEIKKKKCCPPIFFFLKKLYFTPSDFQTEQFNGSFGKYSELNSELQVNARKLERKRIYLQLKQRKCNFVAK